VYYITCEKIDKSLIRRCLKYQIVLNTVFSKRRIMGVFMHTVLIVLADRHEFYKDSMVKGRQYV